MDEKRKEEEIPEITPMKLTSLYLRNSLQTESMARKFPLIAKK